MALVVEWGHTPVMGAWYFSVFLSLTLVLFGLYTHWILIAIGALLPVVPLLAYVLRREKRRPQSRHE